MSEKVDLEEKAICRFLGKALANLGLLVGATVLLSIALGWQIGVGVGLLAIYQKGKQ